MTKNLTLRCLALLLIATGFISYAGCTQTPAAPTQSTAISTAPKQISEAEAASSPVTTEAPAPETTEVPARSGASWITIFGDKHLPEDGWLEEDQVGFYLIDADGNGSVTVMEIPALREELAIAGRMPRTHFFEEQLDERYELLFMVFDMALELGSRQFTLPTDSLRARDVSEVVEYLNYSFQTYGSRPRFSVTRDLVTRGGNSFHFLTVLLTGFDREDMIKHKKAVKQARKILSEMPKDLSELETAKYLYQYVATHVQYDYDDYYDREDWNCLYDALIDGSAVCSGYAEAVYCLFNLAGIDCLCVDGTVVTEEHVDGHAWNLAKVDGEWYVFDATWDTLDEEHRFYLPMFFGVSSAVTEYYTVRRLSSFLEPIVPVCDKILDPDYLYYLPKLP